MYRGHDCRVTAFKAPEWRWLATKGKRFDPARARADIETAAIRARVYDYHVRPREVLRTLKPLLGHLRELGERPERDGRRILA